MLKLINRMFVAIAVVVGLTSAAVSDASIVYDRTEPWSADMLEFQL